MVMISEKNLVRNLINMESKKFAETMVIHLRRIEESRNVVVIAIIGL